MTAVAGRVADDFVLHDGAVHIVSAVPEGALGDGCGVHNPEALDVRKVIEHQARHGNFAQIFDASRWAQVFHRGFFGVPGKRDETKEAAGLVLQFAQFHEMLDFFRGLFDVPVK